MPYLAGLLLALASILGARKLGLDRGRAFYPLVMGVIAPLYVLFAVIGGASEVLTIEIAIMSLFLVITIKGYRVNLWWIVLGLAAHGLMDTVHSHFIANTGVPLWWPAFCATYDLTAAAVVATMLTHQPVALRAR